MVPKVLSCRQADWRKDRSRREAISLPIVKDIYGVHRTYDVPDRYPGEQRVYGVSIVQ